MSVKASQSKVFPRTGRKRILSQDVQWDVLEGGFAVRGVTGSWVQGVDADLLEKAELHLDLRSLLYALRSSVAIASGVLEDGWKGCDIKVPPDLLTGDYRVKLQVSVVLPVPHECAGRILAKSEEIILLKGPDGDGGDEGKGGSLLTTVPDPDLRSLCQLDIDDQGPTFRVLSELDKIPWRVIATSASFKFGVAPLCLEQILIYIWLHYENQQPWMERWLQMDGVREVEELIDIDPEDGPAEAYEKAQRWARKCVDSVAIDRGAIALFVDAWRKERG